MQVLKQGAEARIYLVDFDGRKVIAKQRFKKSYRHQILDKKLTKERIVQESRQLMKLKGIVSTPAVYLVDLEHTTIYMEYLDALSVKDYISSTNLHMMGVKIGQELALIHNQNIIHGDLTTSNILYRNGLVWIDFGLSYSSTMIEDKGIHYSKKRWIYTYLNGQSIPPIHKYQQNFSS